MMEATRNPGLFVAKSSSSPASDLRSKRSPQLRGRSHAHSHRSRNSKAPRNQVTERLKCVVRLLPPSLKEEEFWEETKDFISDDSTTYKYFAQGKFSKNPTKLPRLSRAYVTFKTAQQLAQFASNFNGKIFSDENGDEQRIQIEFAPFLKSPDHARKFPNEGKIYDDPIYKSFVKSIEDLKLDEEKKKSQDNTINSTISEYQSSIKRKEVSTTSSGIAIANELKKKSNIEVSITPLIEALMNEKKLSKKHKKDEGKKKKDAKKIILDKRKKRKEQLPLISALNGSRRKDNQRSNQSPTPELKASKSKVSKGPRSKGSKATLTDNESSSKPIPKGPRSGNKSNNNHVTNTDTPSGSTSTAERSSSPAIVVSFPLKDSPKAPKSMMKDVPKGPKNLKPRGKKGPKPHTTASTGTSPTVENGDSKPKPRKIRKRRDKKPEGSNSSSNDSPTQSNNNNNRRNTPKKNDQDNNKINKPDIKE